MAEPRSIRTEDEQIIRIQMIGRFLILAGALVWVVWLAVKLSGTEPHVQYFLPFHLGGVVPGSIMSRWGAIRRWLDRRA